MKKRIAPLVIVAAVALIAVGSAIPQSVPPPRPYPQGRPLGLADIKMLARGGVSDEIIISQIRVSRTVYHLSTAEILDLKDNRVSDRVIDFMINTPNLYPQQPPARPPSTPPSAPPPPPTVEPTPVPVTGPPPSPIVDQPPGTPPWPSSVWIAGFWRWASGWMWTRGHWELPPFPGDVWVPPRYEHRIGGRMWIPGYWTRGW